LDSCACFRSLRTAQDITIAIAIAITIAIAIAITIAIAIVIIVTVIIATAILTRDAFSSPHDQHSRQAPSYISGGITG